MCAGLLGRFTSYYKMIVPSKLGKNEHLIHEYILIYKNFGLFKAGANAFVCQKDPNWRLDRSVSKNTKRIVAVGRVPRSVYVQAC